jgi:hypothetical protein
MPFAVNDKSECVDCQGKKFPLFWWCHKKCKYNKKEVIVFGIDKKNNSIIQSKEEEQCGK